MANWLEHGVQVEVNLPIDKVWELWSDLEQMPRWMKWIDSVTVLKDDPSLSQWRFASGTFHFDWRSRITELIEHQIIRWESVDGLPNRGAIRFYDRGESSVVRLSIAYDVPPVLAFMDGWFLGRLVESTIQQDLERFREYALKTVDSSIEEVTS
ncbi:MAG: SRPBCC family protein [Leptolyngbyaceae bacterium]|nr:SRPBCC family protein [Leptolyngbyaceae bacterium]